MSTILFHPSSPLYDAALQLTQAQLAQARVNTSTRLVRESIECIEACLTLICKRPETGPDLYTSLDERCAGLRALSRELRFQLEDAEEDDRRLRLFTHPETRPD
jgi:hypothetical protein